MWRVWTWKTCWLGPKRDADAVHDLLGEVVGVHVLVVGVELVLGDESVAQEDVVEVELLVVLLLCVVGEVLEVEDVLLAVVDVGVVLVELVDVEFAFANC